MVSVDSVLTGQRIKQARNEKGLTLQEVAEKVGVIRSTVQRYEAGKINDPSIPVLESLARALDVNAAWLKGESEKKVVERNTIELDELGFAFYGAYKELGDEDRKELLRLAERMKKG
ncbi:hypothetical protein FACS1894202_14100 [Clostridia bacterium]|nr:hypothetical protein FACS1894202_14100 [Clostridia bacterium]